MFVLAEPILESKCMHASFQKKCKKGQKNVKKGQNIWKFGQKCSKFQNILKKDRWLRTIITRNKLLEKALVLNVQQGGLINFIYLFLLYYIFILD